MFDTLFCEYSSLLKRNCIISEIKFISKNGNRSYFLTILFLFFTYLGCASNYYISNSGNDSNAGTSEGTAWKTIAKINTILILPGDKILFNCGDTFYGTIIITKSGSLNNPIIIGAYGTGNNPVITGFTTLSGWSNEGGKIFSKLIASEALTNMVTVSGVQVAMGRTPDDSYNTYESFSTNTSITDNELGDATNWTGAEAVIRKNQYHIDRCFITKHKGEVLTYTSLGSANFGTANYGYFIQNDIRCLTETNEWFHDYGGTDKFYIYGDPSSKIVKVPTLNYLLYNKGHNYITVENIDFKGSISHAIYCTNKSNNITVNNCKVSNAGKGAVVIIGENATVVNNNIENSNATAIYVSGASGLISGNKIENIGVIVGQSLNSQYDLGSAIFTNGESVLIQYNSIKKVAYNGICSFGSEFTINYNLIDSACMILTDGGGIYVTDASSSVRTIDHNIILNSVGNLEGATGNLNSANGIYLDDNASNVLVTNNSIANCKMAGIFNHLGSDNIFRNNVLFKNTRAFWFQNNDAGNNISGNEIFQNICVAINKQRIIVAQSTENDIPFFGISDSNYYTNPINSSAIIYINQPSTGEDYLTLQEWKTFTSQDGHSQGVPVTITDIDDMSFHYNSTKSSIIIHLDFAMVDIENKFYANNITLQPYSSVVLIKVLSDKTD